ncbi:hypothetical protein [Paenibacillus sp. P36]|uniref:hypothetical protein n=1 Tax=Paenibacillus sp. P36 TaxID=3342538 RepID=UPI0038B26AB0
MQLPEGQLPKGQLPEKLPLGHSILKLLGWVWPNKGAFCPHWMISNELAIFAG